ncbi:UDP-N-acetylglucosamine 46-dehydratase protein [Marine Group I thaumarchaeote SCGC AAA799-D07]|nr:UDP-N-acetylglucosamine 46-dehydratase protein [Marine Group I thaumarchaeote SCGC AAA799-D07]
MFDGKKILVTGGTGSLGRSLTKRLLSYNADSIRIYSRNENQQVKMQSEFNDPRLRFLIGDVRDLNRLARAMEGIDIVFHAAALKHVPVVEYNPFEAVQTNILGSQNVINASLEENVEVCVCIGTDKAVAPLNTYGATKLLMEKLFVTAGNYLNPIRHKTKFIAVRYGNVLGSSGSVVPKIVEQIKSGKKITVTDPNMTRFNITMNQALDLIERAATTGKGGEVFIPKLLAYRVRDLKDVLLDLFESKNPTEIISIRPGEKFNESLLTIDELRNTYESKHDYILIEKSDFHKTPPHDYEKTSLNEQYSSNKVKLLTKDELKEILQELLNS